MTSLPSSLTRGSAEGRSRSAAEVRRDLATRRPLVLTATVGGALAALGPLMVCLALGVVGWFLTDAGGHGQPSDALRVGAFGWLLAHGSGVVVDGVRITAIPLGITLGCAWATWRLGHRVGEAVSGHGPDNDRIADGERDWTVPVAVALFAAGYVVVGVGTAVLASTMSTAPSLTRVVGSSIGIAAIVGGPAIARGAGRAAIWTQHLPSSLRAAYGVARGILVWWLGLSTLAFLVALVLDFSTAANITSQLDGGTADTVALLALSLALLPNAALFTSSYLMGPGFVIGTGTLVSPTLVVLGPLPMVPMLAALPDSSPTPSWTPWLMVTPVLLAAVVAGRAVHRHPAGSWDRAAVRGCGGGIVAGVLLGALTAFAGGAVGPGRMQDVGPVATDVLLHATTALGIGGLLGALAVTGWQSRGGRLRDRLSGLRARLPRRG
ncbi:cell division protein PerM [Nocardioides sambongensis]|uniref:cell division protein PerM n=1 Tax=Nocardioides sambongensis TaxID=2589074 RepID=UPI001125F7AF|nr:DUF6350 family protein [Nocardioides sambongensis]